MKARLLVIGVILLSVGIYYLMSPYQECMRFYTSEVASTEQIRYPEVGIAFKKDLCRLVAKILDGIGLKK